MHTFQSNTFWATTLLLAGCGGGGLDAGSPDGGVVLDGDLVGQDGSMLPADAGSAKAMVTTWRITDENDDITLPLGEGFAYDFSVDWGDGSPLGQVTAFDDVDATHVFSVAGDYTVTLTGTAEAWSMGEDGEHPDRLSLLTVPELGGMGWRSFYRAFYYCDNLTTVAGGDMSNVTVMRGMFYGAGSANPNTSLWDTSNVTDMMWMFAYADVATPDTRLWDTSNVNNMSWMFHLAISANPDTSLWDTSNVTTMGDMFSGATSANPDTSLWDTSNVTYMDGMFASADVANPDTTLWDTSNVTNMDGMFASASVNPDTSLWDTSNVSFMRAMFYGATSANPVMSGWDFAALSSASATEEMLSNSGVSSQNYSDLLVRLAATAPTAARLLSSSAKYKQFAVAARAQLVADGWTITDDGLE